MIVGAAGDNAQPFFLERVGKSLGVFQHFVFDSRLKDGWSASPKETALAAMTCISGPPCVPGKTALSIFLAYSPLLKNHAATRAA